MAGVTSEGLIPKTYNEIVTDITDRAVLPEYFGEEMPTSPDSIFGVLTAIIAASLKDQWDLSQNVADQQNRDKAEGKYLDDLAALVGLTRIKQSGSTGRLQFFGQPTASIPNRTAVQDLEKRIVLTQEALVLNRSVCYTSSFAVNTPLPNTVYSVVVEGIDFNINSGSGTPTAEYILQLLNANIGVQSNFSSSLSDDDLLMTITYDGFQNLLTTTNTNNLTLSLISSVVDATAVDEGALVFQAGVLDSIISPLSLISSVTNPAQFNLGRGEETDAELRIRMADREQSTGTATKPSIEASLEDIVGVTSALVRENITLVTDADNVPAKSYESFVQGGDEDDIANVIWATKPAGIQTYGDISRNVIDENGDTQTVLFSRLTDQYAWVKVTYQINSEEDFPANGEVLIKEAVVETGVAMYLGEDFEPTKFYGNIYKNVAGVYVSLIEIATTTLPTDTPVYTTVRIPVSQTEKLIFDTSRVPVTT